MKLRLRANTLRFRLTQAEITALRDTGRIEAITRFSPDQTLTYRLSVGTGYSANFSHNIIHITIPAADAARWTSTDLVGLYTSCPISSTESIELTLEKDFTCLTPRTTEDNLDTFPHPGHQCPE